ncbi:MAG: MauE/DoxX family redox-associated membrane protein [Bacteroidota bacterium]
MNKKHLVAEFSIALLILLFGYTAISKAIDIRVFRHALAESPVTQHGAAVAAWLTISAEAAIVLLLFFFYDKADGIVFVFCYAILFYALPLMYGIVCRHLPCGCGGVMSKMSWKQHILFNLFFLIVNGVAIWQWRTPYPTGKINKLFHAAPS